jgi:hypothetical protein
VGVNDNVLYHSLFWVPEEDLNCHFGNYLGVRSVRHLESAVAFIRSLIVDQKLPMNWMLDRNGLGTLLFLNAQAFFAFDLT